MSAGKSYKKYKGAKDKNNDRVSQASSVPSVVALTISHMDRSNYKDPQGMC